MQHLILGMRRRFSLTKRQGGIWSTRTAVPGEDVLSWGEDPRSLGRSGTSPGGAKAAPLSGQ